MSWKEMAAEHLVAELMDQRRPTTYTIVGAERKKLQKLDGKGERPRAVLSFKETDLTFPLNATNLLLVQAIWPNDRDAINQPIHLYVTEDRLGGETVKCIRVWGSPSLPADRTVTIQPNKRKRPMQVTLRKAAGGAPAPGRGSSSGTPAAAAPAPAGPPLLSEVEVMALQTRINTTRDPVEVDDLRRELEPLKPRMSAEARAVIRAAFESADERCGGPPP